MEKKTKKTKATNAPETSEVNGFWKGSRKHLYSFRLKVWEGKTGKEFHSCRIQVFHGKDTKKINDQIRAVLDATMYLLEKQKHEDK